MRPRLVVNETLYRILAESGEVDLEQFVVDAPVMHVTMFDQFELPKMEKAPPALPYYRRFEKRRF